MKGSTYMKCKYDGINFCTELYQHNYSSVFIHFLNKTMVMLNLIIKTRGPRATLLSVTILLKR